MTNRQDRNKAETCLEWYKAMATDAEQSMLRSRDSGDGERRTTAAKVDGLIVARLKDAFRRDAGVNVPRGLFQGRLLVSAVASRISELKKSHTVSLNPGEFQTWRTKYEVRQPSPVAPKQASKNRGRKRK